MKILVIRFSSIGDIVLCTPVFRWLKSNLPESEVHFLTKGKFKQVVHGNPNLDRVFEWENAADKSEMFSTDYDLIVDLHNNLRTRLVKWRFWGVPTRVLSKENVQKMLLVGRSKNRLMYYLLKFRWIQQLFFGFSGDGNSAELGSSRHSSGDLVETNSGYGNSAELGSSRHSSGDLVETNSGYGNSAEWSTTKYRLAVINIVVRNLSLLGDLKSHEAFLDLNSTGVVSDSSGVLYGSDIVKSDSTAFIPSSSELELDFFVEEPAIALKLPEKFAALILGGTYATKQMPLELLVKILNELKGSVVLLGGPAESNLAENLVSMLNRLESKVELNILNYCGKLNLNDSAWVASKSSVVVSGDTGMAHISAALGCNLVMVWGNTVPEFGMVPPVKQGANSHHFNVLDLDCRPCSKLGFDSCPKQHFRCMNGQDSQAIRASMEKYL
jgi:ADP-heptose:LPS heptosyltransferase